MKLEIIWPPKFVRILKFTQSRNAIAPALAPEEHVYGVPNTTGSLPIYYTIDGWLMRLPLAGEPVRVLRVARNGVAIPGVYLSSVVTEVPHDGEFVTMNSVYHWREIAAPPSLPLHATADM